MGFFIRGTIRGQIFKTFIVVILSLAVLSGLSIYSLISSQVAFRRSNEIEKQKERSFFEVRLALEKFGDQFNLIFAGKGHDGSLLLNKAKTKGTLFISELHKIKKLTDDPGMIGQLGEIEKQFQNVSAIGRDGAMAYIESHPEKGDGQAAIWHKNFETLQTTLNGAVDGLVSSQQLGIYQMLYNLLWVVIAVSILALIIPGWRLWQMTASINRRMTASIGDLHHSAEQNNSSSGALRISAQTLEAAASEQSSAIQESVASMSEMRSMISQTAEYVRNCQKLSEEVTAKTQSGSRIMADLENSMDAIDQANSQLQSLVEIINDIKDKTKIINDIVFKTQLLSFNASIEAARAGQHGRGFAVVAQEVGSLAKMSGSAAREIETLLQNSQKQVIHIIDSVQGRVKEGKTVSVEALNRFSEIAVEIVNITEKIGEVGKATHEQEGGINQTSNAMDQLDASALQNSKAAEEIAGLADKGKILSEKIKATCGELQAMVGKIQKRKAAEPKSPSADPKREALSQGELAAKTHSLLAKRDRLVNSGLKDAKKLDADDDTFKRAD